MYTKADIANLGLGKIGSSRVTSVDAPKSPIDKIVALGFNHWKRDELSTGGRRWVCATEKNYKLTLTETLTDVAKPYKYAVPAACLRVIKKPTDTYEVAGKYIYSDRAEQYIDFVKDIEPDEFDVFFAEVLACRIAMEAVEPDTQSNTKADRAIAVYDRAVTNALKSNAFVVLREQRPDDDADFELITTRW